MVSGAKAFSGGRIEREKRRRLGAWATRHVDSARAAAGAALLVACTLFADTPLTVRCQSARERERTREDERDRQRQSAPERVTEGEMERQRDKVDREAADLLCHGRAPRRGWARLPVRPHEAKECATLRWLADNCEAPSQSSFHDHV